MKNSITLKIWGNAPKYFAKVIDLPGSPPVGEGITKVEAVTMLVLRLLRSLFIMCMATVEKIIIDDQSDIPFKKVNPEFVVVGSEHPSKPIKGEKTKALILKTHFPYPCCDKNLVLKVEEKVQENAVNEAVNEAARIIFHGMSQGGMSREDEAPGYEGFKKEMARVIKREITDRIPFLNEK